ncbi:uncharacterized protein EV422DRAFT_604385 [Fimicolochytrium jonesii]|uniref:uncharacterized protein n=1 Tax=Fimicolochytrium jonesii TaxID=1396493 RepID=UPI0022FE86F1|nr:uncharacterized protein EV422DRAFT_604385 [Fimicolochytrium jonesii]KAI8817617.1 hypothetical protein EV422DRAFT_604385 [Fimicolochytrium jonesii]
MPVEQEDQDASAVLTGQMANFEKAVTNLTSLLDPVLDAPLDQLLATLDAFDRAKLEVLLAFALNTITFVYLRTQGHSTKEHPVKIELDRVKEYFKKLKDAAGLNKPTMRIDKGAAKRFINNSLIANSEVNEEVKKRKLEQDADDFLRNLQIPEIPAAKANAPSTLPTSGASTPDSRSEAGDEKGPAKKKKKTKKKDRKEAA